MFFQVQYVLRDVGLAEGQTMDLTEASPYPTTLVIRRPLPGEDPKVQGADCLGAAQTEERVTEKVRPQFEHTDDPRPAVVEIAARVGDRLSGYALRAACVLRWRTGRTGHSPIRYTRGLHWSDDGQTWMPVPGEVKLGIDAGLPYWPISEGLQSSFTSLVQSGESEPLAHELFNEAWNLRAESPRSSLLIGITSAEVGVKSLIGALVPHAEWLAFNAPTPPLPQILAVYLPSLPVKQTFGVSPFIPQRLLDVMKKGYTLRNQTAHAGKDISPEVLKEILVAVRDLLYLLDVYSGHIWAFDNVSVETTKLIQAEVQTRKDESS